MPILLLLLAILGSSILSAQPGWRRFTPLNLARSFHNALYIGNGKVLVLGGLTYLSATPTATESCELINITTGLVALAAPMHDPHAEFITLVTPDSNVVAISGLAAIQQQGVLTGLVELYDRATGKWRTLGSLTTPRRQHSAAFINDHEILVVGGRHQDHSVMNDAEIFNITTGQSRPAARFPYPVSSASMEYDSLGELLVLGGRDGGANSGRNGRVFRYNIPANSWEEVDTLPSRIQGTQLLKLWSGGLMISGGSRRESPPDFVSDVAIHTLTGWRLVGPMQSERQWSAMAQWSGDTVMTGGGFDNNATMLPTTDWVDRRRGTLTPGPPFNQERSYFSMVSIPGCGDGVGLHQSRALLAIGGRIAWDVGTASVEILDRYEPLRVDPGAATTICSDGRVTLGGRPTARGIAPPYTYHWEPSTGLSCTDCPNPTASPASTTTYHLTLGSLAGCGATIVDSVVVTVRNCADPHEEFVYNLPNVCVGSAQRIYIPYFNTSSTDTVISIRFVTLDPGSVRLDTTLPVILTPLKMIEFPVIYAWLHPGLQRATMILETTSGIAHYIGLVASVGGVIIPLLNRTEMHLGTHPGSFDTCVVLTGTFYTSIRITDVTWSGERGRFTLISPLPPFVVKKGEPLSFCFHSAPGTGFGSDTLLLAGEGSDSCSIPFCVAHEITIDTLPPPTHPLLSGVHVARETTTDVMLNVYPNPISSSTTVEFIVRHPSHATLSLLDAAGAEQLILFAKRVEPGAVVVPCNVQSLQSGRYFLRLEVDGYRLIREIVVVR